MKIDRGKQNGYNAKYVIDRSWNRRRALNSRQIQTSGHRGYHHFFQVVCVCVWGGGGRGGEAGN